MAEERVDVGPFVSLFLSPLYVSRLVSPRETIFTIPLPPREFIIYDSRITHPIPRFFSLSLSLSQSKRSWKSSLEAAQRNRQAGNFDVNEPFHRSDFSLEVYSATQTFCGRVLFVPQKILSRFNSSFQRSIVRKLERTDI